MKQYQTALYMRLSKEDSSQKESNSIASQRLLLQNYLQKHPEFNFYREYIDDGKTGTNFNRPAFQEMLNAVEKKEIDCILCKDCSRFGRDYIECGIYVREFDDYQIRFIALNDNFDSFDRDRDDTIFAIKNIINAEYSKSKSRDIKKIFKEQQHAGQYMGAFAVYGYQKDPSDKHHFVLDPYAASVVTFIFQTYRAGYSKADIAKQLNHNQVLSPESYKHFSGSQFSTSKEHPQRLWSYGAVHTILNNPVYLGHTVQNKTFRRRMKGRAFKNPPEKWIIVENTHQPIISQELWDSTRKLTKNKNL